MTNIKEVNMIIDITLSDKIIGNVDVTIKNGKLFVAKVDKIDDVLYANTFIDMLLEEVSSIKHQFKCKQIIFSLMNSKNITKNDILNFLTNQYY